MKHVHLTSVSSTNDYCKQLLAQEAAVIVTADVQTAGRGQRGRQWHSPVGNLYCSIGIRHPSPLLPHQTASLLFASALSLKATTEWLLPRVPLLLKYPNDLYAQHNDSWKKLAGILIENIFSGERCVATIIGIGLNVQQRSFPPPLEDTATSLLRCGADVPVTTAFMLLTTFYEMFSQFPPDLLYQYWKSELALQGLWVCFADGARWQVREILPSGALQLQQRDLSRTYHFSAGSIRYALETAFQQRQLLPPLIETLKARAILPASVLEKLRHIAHQSTCRNSALDLLTSPESPHWK